MSTLTVFDLDETLFNSPGKVYIRHKVTKEYLREASSSLTDDLEEFEEFDYSDFRSAKLFYDRAKPIEKMVKRYHKILKDREATDRACIITARADFDDRALFLSALKKHNIYYDDVHVHRAGNHEDLAPTTPLRKCAIIGGLLTHWPFTVVQMFDDSYKNLQAFLGMKSVWRHVKFKAYHVNHKGEVSRYKLR